MYFSKIETQRETYCNGPARCSVNPQKLVRLRYDSKKLNLNNPQLETDETCCCDLCSSEHFFAGRPFFVKSAFLTISKQRHNDQKEVFFVKYVE